MIGITITKLERDESGVWTARISCNGETIPVTRLYGSWGTVPEGGVWKDLRHDVAAEIQGRVRTIERRERTGVA